MSSYKRNLLVGAMVLVALCTFGWFFLAFGVKAVSLFTPPQASIEIDAARADGLAEQSDITYQGRPVGHLTKIIRNANGLGVTMFGVIDTQPPVPVNVDAQIVLTGLLGAQAKIALNLRRDPATGAEEAPQFPVPGEPLKPIRAEYVGLSILPEQYTIAVARFGAAADEFSRAAATLRESGFYGHLDQTVQNLNIQLNEAGKILASIQSLTGDHATQADLRTTLANLHQASANLARFAATLPQLQQQGTTTIGHVDDLTRQVSARLTQMSDVLTNLQTITDKINKGQGTAGMLVNDPRLYQALVASTRDLDAAIQYAQRLFQQWEQEGLHFKL